VSPAPNGKNMMLHYIFVEAEAAPLSKPNLLWLNGGPGASSIFGLMVELGPLLLNSASYLGNFSATGLPNLMRNKYAWTKVANLLVLDFPPPVGFSYCDHNVSGDGYSCGNWDDALTADVNHRAMIGVKKDLPQFFDGKRELFMIGESYAGVYTPMLAQRLIDDAANAFNVVGVAVGDGCAGTEVLCGDEPSPYQRGLGPFYWLLVRKAERKYAC
jgi:serine carboxypeptidase-like clade 1